MMKESKHVTNFKSDHLQSGESVLHPDAIEQIKKLAELKDAGVLTDEEFQAKKEKLLAEI
ncbi:SHOCT domain-containing protein [Salinivibrio kushneri]|uniref:SHOCT domain-containing protein n=1 Tax=Salinivibrio kushneri TaxID=1908198 RepID=UPI0009891FC3|nr:SHOCT domain-containing protein [Salinivibrio kushneri]